MKIFTKNMLQKNLKVSMFVALIFVMITSFANYWLASGSNTQQFHKNLNQLNNTSIMHGCVLFILISVVLAFVQYVVRLHHIINHLKDEHRR